MSWKPSTTACWLIVSFLAFGLGWMLKPDPEPEATHASRNPAGAEKFSAVTAKNSPRAAKTGTQSGDQRMDTRRVGPAAELNSVEIEALGRQFKNDLDPITRRLAFSKLLEGLTAANAKEIRAQIEHMPSDSPEFMEFHYAWGKIAGAEAVLHGADTPKPDMAATLAGWASADPAAAMKWFGGLENGSDKGFASKDHLKMGMVNGLANTDPAKATAFVMEMAASGDKQAEKMLGIVTGKVLQSKGPAGAAAWAQNLPPGDLRTSAMDRVAHDYAKNDPEAAAKWAAGLSNEENSGRVVGAISSEWARRDGPAAVGWLESLNDGPGKSGAFYSTFEGWAGKDPLAASKYLVTMPTSPARDQAIGGLVSQHRWEDPVAAVTWAGQISDAKTREASLVNAGQAYFKRDPAAATEWLATSGLPPEARAKVTTPK